MRILSPGGMVNLISKKPTTGSSNKIELATGSRNLNEASIESSGQLGTSDLSYSLVGLARTRDAQAETAKEERYMVAPSLDWQISDDTLVNVNLYYQKDPEMGIYTSLPASVRAISAKPNTTRPPTRVKFPTPLFWISPFATTWANWHTR